MDWLATNPLLGLGLSLAAFVTMMVLGAAVRGMERSADRPTPWRDEAVPRADERGGPPQRAERARPATPDATAHPRDPSRLPVLTDVVEPSAPAPVQGHGRPRQVDEPPFQADWIDAPALPAAAPTAEPKRRRRKRQAGASAPQPRARRVAGPQDLH